MPKYLDEQGNRVAADNPRRLVWFSASCSYWTDDWDKLRSTGPGIPCCPDCGCPGLQMEHGSFHRQAHNFEAAANPGYCTWLEAHFEKCQRKHPEIKSWEKTKAERGALQ